LPSLIARKVISRKWQKTEKDRINDGNEMTCRKNINIISLNHCNVTKRTKNS